MQTIQSNERRRRRSADPLVALHYQLTHARSEAAFDTIVIADRAGVVVAGAGSWAACEELAAYAPLLESGSFGESERMAELRERVTMRSVDIGGDSVLLCAIASRAPVNEAAPKVDVLGRAAAGISRILVSH
ncbi:hypothetical protein BH09MYX1_BH09MYX1_10450 [soil metagenome]